MRAPLFPQPRPPFLPCPALNQFLRLLFSSLYTRLVAGSQIFCGWHFCSLNNSSFCHPIFVLLLELIADGGVGTNGTPLVHGGPDTLE